MQLRNLTRVHTYRRTVNKYNKIAPHKLTRRQISVLFVLATLNQTRPLLPITAVLLRLQSLSVRFTLDKLRTEINYLCKCGYVMKTHPPRFQTYRIYITMEGMNELNEIERKHKAERLGK